jgi:predicted nucleotidyltransferase
MANSAEEEKLARIAANFNRHNKLEDKRIRIRVREAKTEVQQLVRRFREIDPDVDRIVLFGSLAEGTVFSLYFDIDLAVRSRRYLELVSCGLNSSFSVDVVDLDNLAEPIRSAVEKYGKVLYEKKKH